MTSPLLGGEDFRGLPFSSERHLRLDPVRFMSPLCGASLGIGPDSDLDGVSRVQDVPRFIPYPVLDDAAGMTRPRLHVQPPLRAGQGRELGKKRSTAIRSRPYCAIL